MDVTSISNEGNRVKKPELSGGLNEERQLKVSTQIGPEKSTADIQKQITEAFEVFDHEKTDSVDIREIGTIVRSLGFCPTEMELQDLLREMEGAQHMGSIHLDKFLPVMMNVFRHKRFQPEPLETLLKAFKVLDKENKGEMSVDEIKKLFMEKGERFGTDEMEEMLNAAIDAHTRTIVYKNFVHFLAVEDD